MIPGSENEAITRKMIVITNRTAVIIGIEMLSSSFIYLESNARKRPTGSVIARLVIKVGLKLEGPYM